MRIMSHHAKHSRTARTARSWQQRLARPLMPSALRSAKLPRPLEGPSSGTALMNEEVLLGSFHVASRWRRRRQMGDSVNSIKA